jgi:imidazolonepropionase-like amidohydrolase
MDRERIAIRAGRLVDVEASEVRMNQTILVRGDRIEAVVPGDQPVPDDTQTIDLSAATVAPGLIDLHAHLIGSVDEGHGYAVMLQRSGAQEALTGVANARATLRAGFTTVRDVGTFRALVDIALRDAIEAGVCEGPRMACAGAYLTCSGGGGDITGIAADVVVPRELRFGVAEGVEEVRGRVRDILHAGADLIKVIATGAVLTEGTVPGAPEFSRDELRAAVEEAALYDAYVAAHAHGAAGIKNAVLAGVRSVEHGSLMDDECIELMADRGTYLVADIYCGDWIEEEGRRRGWSPAVMRKNEETTEAQRGGFRKAVKAGVKIGFGTDSGVYPHGWNAKQLPYMVRYGMTPMQAIESATIVAAEAMGWSDRVGSISHGKFADLVAVDGNAMEDLTSFSEVSFVMKGGATVVGEGAAAA